MTNNPRAQKGFTLLEVLVASLILFLVIVTMMNVYRGAILSSSKAERSLSLVAEVPQLRPLITQEIQASSGESYIERSGVIGEISFQWRAEPVIKGRAYSPENEDMDSPFYRSGRGSTLLYLWVVDLTVSMEGMQRSYQFEELSW